jgi:hypothetical protein
LLFFIYSIFGHSEHQLKTALSFFLFCFCIQISIGQTPGEWVWLKGSNTSNVVANWGIQGVPSPTNNPPSLYEPCEWTDKDGSFWMFGGISRPSYVYCALWKYNPMTNEWTWMKGPNDSICNAGSFGIQGVPDPTNYPPTSLFVAASWVDTVGDLWMFEGGGCLPSWGGADRNTLWRYQIATNEWTWMKGPDTINDPGVWGIRGVPDIANYPCSRDECAAAWVDDENNLWMFGGLGRNDLWRYNISTNIWTWMKGTQAWNDPGVYGALGIEDSANTPGARGSYTRWKGNDGNLWLFGGLIYNSQNSYNDLWKYNISTNNWTWMHGSNTPNATYDFIDHCKFSPINVPNSRMESRACWKDLSGNFWFFGGARLSNKYNDLWKYCPQLNQWALVNGVPAANPTGYWGTQGVCSPLNHPNGRYGSVGWTDNNNHLYLFGGEISGSGYNDIWMYTIDTTCATCDLTTEIENTSSIERFLTIIPNPNDGTFIIHLNAQCTIDNLEIEIYNSLGEKVYSQIHSDEKINSKLNLGVYFLKVNDGEKVYTQKMVIQ